MQRRPSRLVCRCRGRFLARATLGSGACQRLLAGAVLALACAGGDARLEVSDPSSFARGPIRLSVLGVYRDGNLSEASSVTLASELSRALPSPNCAAGYGPTLRVINLDAFSAIDTQTKLDGVDDDFLAAIAPAAGGDHILVVQMYGRISAAGADASGRVLIAHGGARIHSDVSRGTIPPKDPDLDILASVFSVRRRHTEARLRLGYTGSSVDGAIREVAEELSSNLPNAACGGWNWGSVAVVRELDALGLPLRRFRLVPVLSR